MTSRPEVPVAEKPQIANYADWCNDCGNCDVFCPEDGRPYVLKPRVFVDAARWSEDAPRDAILVEAGATSGRFGGEVVRLGAGEAPGADPRLHVLARLRASLLAPGEVNPVAEHLRESETR